jgi:hypothetical protein
MRLLSLLLFQSLTDLNVDDVGSAAIVWNESELLLDLQSKSK